MARPGPPCVIAATLILDLCHARLAGPPFLENELVDLSGGDGDDPTSRGLLPVLSPHTPTLRGEVTRHDLGRKSTEYCSIKLSTWYVVE